MQSSSRGLYTLTSEEYVLIDQEFKLRSFERSSSEEYLKSIDIDDMIMIDWPIFITWICCKIPDFDNSTIAFRFGHKEYPIIYMEEGESG
jgi:hypothetical protein